MVTCGKWGGLPPLGRQIRGWDAAPSGISSNLELLVVLRGHGICVLRSCPIWLVLGFPGGASAEEPTCWCRRHKRCGFDPWVGKVPWKRSWQPTHSSSHAWKTPWTEDPGRLQSLWGSQRVRQDWSDLACMCARTWPCPAPTGWPLALLWYSSQTHSHSDVTWAFPRQACCGAGVVLGPQKRCGGWYGGSFSWMDSPECSV